MMTGSVLVRVRVPANHTRHLLSGERGYSKHTKRILSHVITSDARSSPLNTGDPLRRLPPREHKYVDYPLQAWYRSILECDFVKELC